MKIVLIAAMTQDRVIGKDGRMPWKPLLPDLKRFRELTLGHPVIMGRKTYESIGKPLDGRLNIVLTRDPKKLQPYPPGLLPMESFSQALGYAMDANNKVFVIGGADVYRQALPHAHEIQLTVIFEKHEGDTYFPELDLKEWVLVSEFYNPGNDKRPAFSFCKYERRGYAQQQ